LKEIYSATLFKFSASIPFSKSECNEVQQRLLKFPNISYFYVKLKAIQIKREGISKIIYIRFILSNVS